MSAFRRGGRQREREKKRQSDVKIFRIEEREATLIL